MIVIEFFGFEVDLEWVVCGYVLGIVIDEENIWLCVFNIIY